MGKQESYSIDVDGLALNSYRIDDKDYISLTDMIKGSARPADVITNWIRTLDTLDFLAEWEKLYNPDFKVVEYHNFTSQAGRVRFTLSVGEWIESTNAIGLISKRGRYGGTYAHRDIAFEFATRISARFKLLLVREFQRLKEDEANRLREGWDYGRYLSKVNYRLHTDTIRDHLLPRLKEAANVSDVSIYADEADLLNLATFGLTAKQWREQNPTEAKAGNIRDFADVMQLNVLANLESLNSVMIEAGTSKEKRFQLLCKTAISQYERLAIHPDFKRLNE